MNHPVVRAYVIGQTPRPDLTDDLRTRFPSTSFEVVGALDGYRASDLDECVDCEYPLETRLADGERVLVDASVVEALLRSAIDAYQGHAVAHLILCAGPFPGLAEPEAANGIATPLIRPVDVAVASFRRQGFQRLDVLVPFRAQAGPAEGKWTTAGFTSRVYVLAERPDEVGLAAWVAERVEAGNADALIFDYVGFPSDLLGEVAARIGIPVFDLGHLALDALEEMLAR